MAAVRYQRGIADGRKGEGFPGRRSLWPDGGHPGPNIGGLEEMLPRTRSWPRSLFPPRRRRGCGAVAFPARWFWPHLPGPHRGAESHGKRVAKNRAHHQQQPGFSRPRFPDLHSKLAHQPASPGMSLEATRVPPARPRALLQASVASLDPSGLVWLADPPPPDVARLGQNRMAPKMTTPGADADWPGAEGIADGDGIGARS
jgi:hypothetical protein